MDEEVKAFLLKHLQAIQENDVAAYYETSAEDLTLYEWWVTPHRLDGLPFHEFMMNANAERGSVFGAEDAGAKGQVAPGPGQPAYPALRRHRHRQLYHAGQHGAARRRPRGVAQ